MQNYDIIIIGGGIQGAGVAQAAAASGYKTLLLEQQDFASGTSSRSTKLIHGGLRYLEFGEFSLVRQNLKERELLIRNAPALVKRTWINIPVYQGQQRPQWKIVAGLSAYWLLSGCQRSGQFKRIPKSQWQQWPHLNQQGLEAVYAFQDAQTDDKALTLSVLASAQQQGAALRDHTVFLGAQKHDNGYCVSYQHEDVKHQAQTQLVVNAAGPWVNEVIHKVSPTIAHLEIEQVQGSHLLLSHPKIEQPYYLQAPQDGRPVFVLPYQGYTLVGTTEQTFDDAPEHTSPSEGEVQYLLDVLNHYFNCADITIETTFSGIRTLPAHHSHVHSRSRETVLFCDNRHDASWVSIYGGKLTSYRAVAEDVLEIAKTHLGKRQHAHTESIPLTPATPTP